MNIVKNIFYNNILIIICLIFLSSCNDNELLVNPSNSSEYSFISFDFSDSGLASRPLNFNTGKSSRNYIGRFSENSDSYTLFKINPALISSSNFCLDTAVVSIDSLGLKLIPSYDLLDMNEGLSNNLGFDVSNIADSENVVSTILTENIVAYFIEDLGGFTFSEYDSLNHSEANIAQIEGHMNIENALSVKYENYELSIDFTDVINFENICEGNTMLPFYILLDYNYPDINTGDLTNQQIEFFSTDHSITLLNPKVYVQYTKDEGDYNSINKFIIENINSSLSSSFYNYNTNIESDQFGMTLSLGLENFNLSNPDDEFNFDGYDGDLEVLISAEDSIANIFTYQVMLNDEVADSITNINFYFDNVYFAFRDLDPSLDNWSEVDSTGTQGNGMYDFGESFYDFGYDLCQDENESGDGGCDAQSSLYNENGTEGNNLLDWDDDGDGIWQDGEGEEWFDQGYDQADDGFESGCFNSGYPYGIGIKIPLTYSEIVIQNNLGEEFYDFEFIHSDDCSSLDNVDDCSFNGYCNWSDVDGCLNISTVICGSLYWNDNYHYNSSSSDPHGDNYNADPANDNWNDDDGVWQEGEGTEGNGQYDLGEPFLDFGIDQLPDSLESYVDFDDNWNDNGDGIWQTGEGTEGNGQYDNGELYFDTGSDGIYTTSEEGYNIVGKQGNSIFDNVFSYSEVYNDYGIDNIVDGAEGDTNDNYIADPNNDNYHYLDYQENLDSNGLWDHEDTGEDGCYDEFELGNSNCSDEIVNDGTTDPNNDNYDFENNIFGTENNNEIDNNELYEQWNDLGTDQLPDSLENNYFNNTAEVNLGQNSYNIDLENIAISDTLFFDTPSINSSDQLILWVSSIIKTDDDKYDVNISVNSLVDINGFQFQLKHYPYIENIDIQSEENKLYFYPYEFIDDDNDYFPDTSEIVEDGEKYIQDFSMYLLDESFNSEFSEYIVSYGQGFPAHINFQYAFDAVGNDSWYNYLGGVYPYDDASFNNPNSYNNTMISNDLSKLTLYFDKDNAKHFIHEDGVYLNIGYYDYSTVNAFPEIPSWEDMVIFGADQISSQIFNENIYVTEDMDSVVVEIGPFIQFMLTGDAPTWNSAQNGFVNVFLSDYSNNSSSVVIRKDKSPKLEVFYSE